MTAKLLIIEGKAAFARLGDRISDRFGAVITDRRGRTGVLDT